MEILIPQNFKRHLKNKRATMAAIGPMSKNCVEATIEIANEKNVPIMMILSRNRLIVKSLVVDMSITGIQKILVIL